MENFSLDEWGNNFQYTMQNYRRFFLIALIIYTSGLKIYIYIDCYIYGYFCGYICCYIFGYIYESLNHLE